MSRLFGYREEELEGMSVEIIALIRKTRGESKRS